MKKKGQPCYCSKEAVKNKDPTLCDKETRVAKVLSPPKNTSVGTPYIYLNETLFLKESNPLVDLFDLYTGPGFVSQPHVDCAYDQYFTIVTGTFDVRNGYDGHVDHIGPGDIIYIPKGTPFQFVSTSAGYSYQIGAFVPGGRFQLVQDLAAEAKKGPLTLQRIQELESRYSVYSVDLPGAAPFTATSDSKPTSYG